MTHHQEQGKTDLLQAVFDGTTAGISVLASVRNDHGTIVDFTYLLANRVTQQLTHQSKLGGQLYSAIHPAYRQAGIFDDFVRVVETGQPIECDRHYTGEGFNNWYATVTVKHNDGVVFSFRDITAERTVHQQIEASETELTFAIDAAELGVWDLNPQTNTFRGNTRLKSWFGLRPDDEIPLPLALAVIAENDRDRVRAAIAQALRYESGGQYDVVYTIINPATKEERIVRAKGKAQFDPDQTAVRFNGTLQDVTPQLQARQALEASEQQLRSLVANAPFPIGVYVGKQMRIQLANQAIMAIWGKGIDVIGKRYADLLPELKSQAIFAQLDSVYTTGIPFHARNQRVDLVVGSQIQPYYFNYSFIPLFDADGQVYGVMSTAADVTELALAKQQAEESENRFRTLANSIDQLAWIANADGWIYWYNERWYAYTGTTLEQMQGWGWQTVHHPDHLDRIVSFVKEAWGRDEPFELTFPLRDRTGHYRWFLTRVYPIKDEQGRVVQWVGTNTDIDEQKTMAERLEQLVAERTGQLQTSVADLGRSNENLQQFAYVASHDLQEPLRKIQSFGDLLKNQYADQLGEGMDMVMRMQSAAGRMSTLIRDLLSYSRISTGQAATILVPLNQVVDTALSNLEVAISETAAQVEVAALPTVQGDASQLGQLFQNLLGNALKFHREGMSPVIRISAQRVKAPDLPASVRPVQVVKAYDRIDVCDNGIGFDDKYVNRIFQVFQRLHGKNQYAGTGVGLAICEKVVTNHGGAITAISQPGQGATFSVYLPVFTTN